MKIFSLPGKQDTGVPSGRIGISNLRSVDPFFFELLKGLRAKVEYKMDTLNLRALAVSSAIAGEGKTLTAIHLAANMASTGRKKVLLMDVDLRKSSVARELGLAPDSGLSDFLLGSVSKEKILRNSVVPGLSIIAAGKSISSPADMLAGEQFRFSPSRNCGGSSISWFWTLLPFCPFPTLLRSPNRSTRSYCFSGSVTRPTNFSVRRSMILGKGRSWALS